MQQHIECTDEQLFEDHTYRSYRKAWPEQYGKDDCDSPRLKGKPSAKERHAVSIAYGSGGDTLKHLAHLYDLCAETEESAYYDVDFPDQAVERTSVLRGMLSLCPDYPKRSAVYKAIDDIRAAKQGRLFTDGNYRVGREIQPGTYYATEGDDCYWERDNRAGDIISNHISQARRNQVTILSSDYSFSSERCGTWRRA